MTVLETIVTNPSPSRHVAVAPRRFLNTCDLARQALKQALQVRADLKLGFNEPVCPFDIAHLLGVEVKLQNIPSMEGMYCRTMDGPVIVLASERPTGRQNFNCAHEVGHHVFGHGLSLDEMMEANNMSANRRSTNPVEFLADSFASFLLMPKAAVDRAFALRGLAPNTASPEEIFIVASYLGVGYKTLVTHLQWSLRLLTPERAEELLGWATKLPRIRRNLTGLSIKHVTVVDEVWGNRPVDIHTGDYLLVPRGWSVTEVCLEEAGFTPDGALRAGQLFRATRPGKGELLSPERSLAVRVARQGFAGRSIYRHWDDPEDDETSEGQSL